MAGIGEARAQGGDEWFTVVLSCLISRWWLDRGGEIGHSSRTRLLRLVEPRGGAAGGSGGDLGAATGRGEGEECTGDGAEQQQLEVVVGADREERS
ncbi:hypothetical protein M0R45_036199 [Rubus argutus]|uniref:Uncharacterized protein n=1 Tax=Rubus argutus TaxID=59490 RepID=A0AAW1VWB8_RUBAR